MTEKDKLIQELRAEIDRRIPVVRCRDCVRYQEDIAFCAIHSHFVDYDGNFCHTWESDEWKMFTPDYYCADGRRRESIGVERAAIHSALCDGLYDR